MPFELQGHRGARGLRPENTLPSFEAALDVGVSSIETDVHLTRDGIAVLCHDPTLEKLTAAPDEAAGLACVLIRQITLSQVRRVRVDRNPDPAHFSHQSPEVTPVAAAFARDNGIQVYGVPTLADLFRFAEAYACSAAKTEAQQACARRLRFDLELKRVPFHPETVGDGFGPGPAQLEHAVLEQIRAAGVLDRTIVRSFDHRSVRAIKDLEPRLTTAVIIAATAPVAPETLARDAGASIYSPDYQFVDEPLVRRLHDAGLRVLPWTVNRDEEWERLVAWGVDGFGTDYPDRAAAWLRSKGIEIA